MRSPVTGEQIAALKTISPGRRGQDHRCRPQGVSRHGGWCLAPRRGELVRLLGEELRTHKAELGRLVSIEVGKIPSEGLAKCRR
ncbi:hypothetical protein ACFSQT_11145 [Mesorhizobium calcicola]|uniref:Transposase n=1 Tax=Mesorhizobium calcicola TaxID=1300310 RepID=A0ABW4WCP1_9HYPH